MSPRPVKMSSSRGKPKPKTTVGSDWLGRKDSTGNPISVWCKQLTPTTVFCQLCTSTIDCASKGFQAITQHTTMLKHQKNIKDKLNPNQLRIGLLPAAEPTATTAPPSAVPNVRLSCFNKQDETTKKELLWVLKCTLSNYSAKSCDGVGEIFEAMFGSESVGNFTLGRVKMAYIQTDCLGPYFYYNMVVGDAADAYFTLCFDETTNDKGLKELRHAFAVTILDFLMKALKNAKLPLCKLIMLGCDGPNVNKSVISKMNAAIKKEYPDSKGMLDIGTCNLHVVHNSFKKALHVFSTDVSEVLLDIYYIFDDFPSGVEDFNKILVKLEIPVHSILKHVPSRWLSICGPGKRLLEQWPAFTEYFLKYLPTQSSSADLAKLARYTKIRTYLKDPTMTAKISFAIESAQLFEKFSLCFQKNDPIIHVLYPEMLRLVKVPAGGVCKKQVVENIASESNPFSPDKLLLVKDVLCGDLTEKALAKPSMRESDVLTFRKSVQDFFIQAAKYLLDKEVFKIKSFDNEAKFPLVAKVLKAALAVSHGSSDVERGFSESGNVLTEDKCRMNERSLNAKLNIKSGMKFFHNKPHLLPMDKNLLLSGRLAHSKYKEYLDGEKKKEEEAKRKKKEAEEETRKRVEFLKNQNKMR
ncbi:hypothetical protein FOCC_FOCC012469 [Frankliniella occidentalis]|nr:hypothetical protein FOCC_FOCC012469 [Frankliniella occidentalis]